MSEKIMKKRGRKPKNKLPEIQNSPSPIITEEDTIIAHLPISLEDVVNNESSHDEIFIKSEKDLKKTTHKHDVKVKITEPIEMNPTVKEEEILNNLNKKILEAEKVFMLGKNVNKVNVYNIKFNNNTKCFWCKNTFNHPGLELPDDYYNDTFFCSGYFCSWNCMKAYNIDLNDSNSWKRESLINLMYYKTYGSFKEIIPAPSWLSLQEYGGHLSIDDFRSNFNNPNKEYLILHPPIMTRQLQIEESYKKNNTFNGTIPLSQFENYNSEQDLVLKRSKPLESASLNLEKTLGLKRKVKKTDTETKISP